MGRIVFPHFFFAFFHEKETFQTLTIFLRIQLNYFWKTNRIFSLLSEKGRRRNCIFLLLSTILHICKEDFVFIWKHETLNKTCVLTAVNVSIAINYTYYWSNLPSQCDHYGEAQVITPDYTEETFHYWLEFEIPPISLPLIFEFLAPWFYWRNRASIWGQK